MQRIIKKAVTVMLAAMLLIPTLPIPAKAADRTLPFSQVQRMGVASSADIRKKNSEVLLKQMKYVEAVKGIQAKVKNLRSFRWTPLLSFKFPQKLDMPEEYELNIKPLTLQSEIESLRHQANDLRYAAALKVNLLYTDLYLTQESIAFEQKCLETASAELSRNQTRLRAGQADAKDVETMEKGVKKLQTTLATLGRKLENDKQKLTELIGLDVRTGYRFANPFVELQLSRSELPSIIEHTLANDHAFYEAKLTKSIALLNMNAYENLMRNQYGGKMAEIQPYLTQARQGADIDFAAYQMAFDRLLKNVDQPWQGAYRILFFRFPKEWFKGAISGIRYVEDEMYALYTASKEYSTAIQDVKRAEKDLRRTVTDQFETIVSGYQAFQALSEQSKVNRQTLDRIAALNRSGRAEYSELQDARKRYEDGERERLESLGTYTKQIFDLDRLTCGAITPYLTGTSLSLGQGMGGDSLKVIDPIAEPYYYIYGTISDLTFEVGISIPEDWKPAVTDFEVWLEGRQVGERTPADKQLRHLMFDYQTNSDLTFRLYDGDRLVSECTVDATVPRDRLPIEPAEPSTGRRKIGSYTQEVNPKGGVSLATITLTLPDTTATQYRLRMPDKAEVFSEQLRPLTEPFSYLQILVESLAAVEIVLCDDAGAEIGTAVFEPESKSVYLLPPSKE